MRWIWRNCSICTVCSCIACSDMLLTFDHTVESAGFCVSIRKSFIMKPFSHFTDFIYCLFNWVYFFYNLSLKRDDIESGISNNTQNKVYNIRRKQLEFREVCNNNSGAVIISYIQLEESMKLSHNRFLLCA